MRTPQKLTQKTTNTCKKPPKKCTFKLKHFGMILVTLGHADNKDEYSLAFCFQKLSFFQFFKNGKNVEKLGPRKKYGPNCEISQIKMTIKKSAGKKTPPQKNANLKFRQNVKRKKTACCSPQENPVHLFVSKPPQK